MVTLRYRTPCVCQAAGPLPQAPFVLGRKRVRVALSVVMCTRDTSTRVSVLVYNRGAASSLRAPWIGWACARARVTSVTELSGSIPPARADLPPATPSASVVTARCSPCLRVIVNSCVCEQCSTSNSSPTTRSMHGVHARTVEERGGTAVPASRASAERGPAPRAPLMHTSRLSSLSAEAHPGDPGKPMPAQPCQNGFQMPSGQAALGADWVTA